MNGIFFNWNSLVKIGFVLFVCHLGNGLQFPPAWSLVQKFFDDIEEGLYPRNDQEADEARAALYSNRYGGDIVFEESSPTAYDAAVNDASYRWPGYPGDATIPYVIDSSLSSWRDKILLAMEQYHNLTCIRFVIRTNEQDYIRFTTGQGCSSLVGRVGGEQEIHLGKGCGYVGTMVHEIGHAIGLYHEHQRTDRDEHLNVYTSNVLSGQEHNFQITEETNEQLLTDFNPLSIMIYGNYAFSISPGKKKTMESKENMPLKDPFQKPGMDNTDIAQVNKLYECANVTTVE